MAAGHGVASQPGEVSSQYLGGDDDCRAVLLTAVRSDSKSDLHPPQFFEKIPGEPVRRLCSGDG